MAALTIRQSIEPDVIARLVREDEESAGRASSPIVSFSMFGRDSVLERDGPAGIHDEQGERAQHVQRAALEARNDEGDDAAGYEGPGGVADVEFLLGERVFDADHPHELAKIISMHL